MSRSGRRMSFQSSLPTAHDFVSGFGNPRYKCGGNIPGLAWDQNTLISAFPSTAPQEIQARPGHAHNDYLNTLADWGLRKGTEGRVALNNAECNNKSR